LSVVFHRTSTYEEMTLNLNNGSTNHAYVLVHRIICIPLYFKIRLILIHQFTIREQFSRRVCAY